ncbi:MAG: PLP-dependent aminotransferase family protein [Acidobacteria bacterium]|nr:MAG: PLP-dependent aminotransferase family protein [Acidobacteriota bacterium]
MSRNIDPLYRKFYKSIRTSILTGQFSAGYRLPATRQMAEEYGVSRNTIAAAYDQLIAEGYVQARTGSGTYVAPSIPDDFMQTEVDRQKSHKSGLRKLSTRGAAIAEIRLNWQTRQAPVKPFTPCVPSVADFPFQTWARLTSKRLRSPVRSLWNYGDPAGYKPLREAIAAHLGSTRGVNCNAEQVVVVSGTQQAVDLTARVLLDANDFVWVENPGYMGTRGALLGGQAKVVGVPVDEEGIQVKEGMKKAAEARLVCITPSNQYPLGITMSFARRLELLEWARKSGAWIFEDDYDSEFRYVSRPIAALQGLDRYQRVIYAGTFSKVLNPVLRLGYLVVPEDLINPFIRAKAVMDRHSSLLEQVVLADFFEHNHFLSHIRRMRNLYSERREILISAIQSQIGKNLKIISAPAGLHVTLEFQKNVDDFRIALNAQKIGIELEPLSAFYMNQNKRHGLILGYAPFRPKEIKEGIAKLAGVLINPQMNTDKHR